MNILALLFRSSGLLAAVCVVTLVSILHVILQNRQIYNNNIINKNIYGDFDYNNLKLDSIDDTNTGVVDNTPISTKPKLIVHIGPQKVNEEIFILIIHDKL